MCLHVIYALAIKHRLDPASKDDLEQEQEPVQNLLHSVEEPVARKKNRKAVPELLATV